MTRRYEQEIAGRDDEKCEYGENPKNDAPSSKWRLEGAVDFLWRHTVIVASNC
jgi:hypothetical protein